MAKRDGLPQSLAALRSRISAGNGKFDAPQLAVCKTLGIQQGNEAGNSCQTLPYRLGIVASFAPTIARHRVRRVNYQFPCVGPGR